MKFQNAKNTTGDKKPEGYDRWIKYWEDTSTSDPTIKKEPPCGAADCDRPAEHGAHVQKCDDDNGDQWIAPLCAKCNQRTDCFNIKLAIQIVRLPQSRQWGRSLVV